jgi:hypothetical protein
VSKILPIDYSARNQEIFPVQLRQLAGVSNYK